MTEETKTGKVVEAAKTAAPQAQSQQKRPYGGAGGQRGGQRGGRYPKKNSKGRGPRPSYDDDEQEVWVPKTTLGKKVAAGEITHIDDILKQGSPILEAGIVNKLLPGLNEEVVSVRRVQRTLDSGRRMKFSILAVVGDKNGHVGVGMSKGVEAGPTIKKAMSRAKLNIISVKRACSSWECGCGEPHTVPYKVTGKMGSVEITLKPAPRGVGLVVGDNSKVTLDFAGIRDVWLSSQGHSRTVINQVLAIYDALKKLSTFKEEVSKGVKEVKVKV